jgi:predicted nuclease of predicted toxin-antitoxin system
VRFLIDNNVSPKVAASLTEAGHDAVHVRDYDLQAAPDPVVLARARVERRILVSADTDFGALLAREHAVTPSILLIRRLVGRRAADQAAVILANLEPVAEDLSAGAVVVLTDQWVRIRRLPLLPGSGSAPVESAPPRAVADHEEQAST